MLSLIDAIIVEDGQEINSCEFMAPKLLKKGPFSTFFLPIHGLLMPAFCGCYGLNNGLMHVMERRRYNFRNVAVVQT